MGHLLERHSSPAPISIAEMRRKGYLHKVVRNVCRSTQEERRKNKGGLEADFEALWQRTAPLLGITIERTPVYMQWRLVLKSGGGGSLKCIFKIKH